jgi:uncharacterized membrane protein
MDNIFLYISTAIHLLTTVFWIGGIITFTLIINPTVNKFLESNPKLNEILDVFSGKFILISYLSIFIMWGTGAWMTTVNSNFKGLGNYDTLWAKILFIKHIFVVLISINTFYIGGTLREKIIALKSKHKDKELKVLLEKRNKLLGLNFFLAIIILIFAGILTVVD